MCHPYHCRDLVAYWQFEDTIAYDKKTGASKPRLVAKDSSHHGNHLPLVNPPKAADVIIENDVRVHCCCKNVRVHQMCKHEPCPADLGYGVMTCRHRLSSYAGRHT
jgi:hypothetical protein